MTESQISSDLAQLHRHPTTEVWIARTWDRVVIFHALDRSRQDRIVIDDAGHEAPAASWFFTVCGTPRCRLSYNDHAQRFYSDHARGDVMPFRLLNPAATRPCRRCFPAST